MVSRAYAIQGKLGCGGGDGGSRVGRGGELTLSDTEMTWLIKYLLTHISFFRIWKTCSDTEMT